MRMEVILLLSLIVVQTALTVALIALVKKRR
jgi:hypothetical protein